MSGLKKLSLNIQQKLYAGFGILLLTLVVAVGITISYISDVSTGIGRVANLRVPTSASSSLMVSDINASLASLRGWMLTGNEAFKKERAAVWNSIEQNSAQMDRLSQNWTNPANVKTWTEFKAILTEFKTAQAQVEAIAKSPDEQPAVKILLNEAAPRAAIMVARITQMIDEEATLAATRERKALLGIMADVRGTTGLGLANIRAMLLTGSNDFRAKFETLWAKNERRFTDLTNSRRLLTPSQRTAFDEFAANRAEFAPLPQQMFDIRASDQWNMANYTLVAEAAPRAGRLLTILAGPKADDGSRSGGMTNNQRRLLSDDVDLQQGTISSLQTLEWVLLISGLIISIVAAVMTGRSIVGPLKKMMSVMQALANKDYSTDIPGLDRSDEIGDMARTVEIFKDAGIENDRLQKEVEESRLATEKAEAERREQDQRVEAKRLEDEAAAREASRHQNKQEQLQMAQSFEDSVLGVLQGVSSAATELNATAEVMSEAAGNTRKEAVTASSATSQAGANVQTVAAAAEEMSASISEISHQVTNASEISGKAVTTATNAETRVEELSAAGMKIGEIVNLINDIADQTNLLALNATIEAARAGDAGKGFAVVASEVKSLASQTASATEEIAAQINSMQSITTGAVDAVQDINKTIVEINEISTALAAAIEEQSATTQEISRNAAEAAAGTQDVIDNVTNVNSLAEETGSSASTVLEASGELAQNSEVLQNEVDNFLASIRAA